MIFNLIYVVTRISKLVYILIEKIMSSWVSQNG